MARPGNAIVVGILEYSYRLMSMIHMVIICLVSLDCTIYMLGVFTTEVSGLTGTCICSLFKTRHNTSFPLTKRSEIFAMELNMHNSESSFSVRSIGKMKEN